MDIPLEVLEEPAGAVLIWGGGFLLVLVLSLAWRVFNGASISALFATRFYEVPPVRALMHGAHLALWGALIGAALCAAGIVRDMVTIEPMPLRWQWLGGAAAAAAVAALGQYVVRRAFLTIPASAAPQVDIRSAWLREGIEDGVLRDLGGERFPNVIAPHWRLGLWVRRLCVLVCLALMASAVATELLDPVPEPLTLVREQLAAGAAWAAAIPAGVAVAMIGSCGLLLLGLASTNRDYCLLTFRRSLVVQFGLALAVTAGVARISTDVAAVHWTIAAIAGVWLVRNIADLRLALRYRRIKTCRNELAHDFSKWDRLLARVAREKEFRLADLDREAIMGRISRGAKRVEEKGFLVKRHIARFMHLVEVLHRRFVVLSLRFLTVRRYTTRSAGWSTVEALRHPNVPCWDLVQFPLKAPSGYLDWLDPLQLSAKWDVVAWCSTCGGSGTITVQESYTETEYYTDSNNQTQSRTVTKYRTVTRTCPTCGGTGKLKHHQILNTHWRKFCPTLASDPALPMPELIDEAEEVNHVRLRLVEGLDALAAEPEFQHESHPLSVELANAAEHARAAHAGHCRRVGELFDARIYRSEFLIGSLYALRIRFTRLRGGVGWFFGKRPEFHFPRLPFSISMAATLAFFPPLFAAVGGAAVVVAVHMLESWWP